MNDFKALLGKAIQSVHLVFTSNTNELDQDIRHYVMIVFLLMNGRMVGYRPTRDICLWNEFSRNHFLSPEWENADYILGSPVVSVEVHLLDRIQRDGFVIDYYGLLIRTKNEHQAIFEYRVEHHGYHEGWLEEAKPKDIWRGEMLELTRLVGNRPTIWDRLEEDRLDKDDVV